MKQGMRLCFGKVVAFSLLGLFGALVLVQPSQAVTPLGKPCTTHQQCVTQRCDNRPDAGCVSHDGTGNGGEFCTTHQQCRTGFCIVPSGTIRGQCSGGGRSLGTDCVSHNECLSQRCDNRKGAGCVAQDGTAKGGEICTTHQQCRSGNCNVTNGLKGTCSAGDRPNGQPCSVWSECSSKNCAQGVCAPPKSNQNKAPNPYPLGLAPDFSGAPNRTVAYQGSSQIPPSASTRKTVITGVKNTCQYQILLSYHNKYGSAVGSSVWVNPGALTSHFNGYEATALWKAIGPESGSFVGGNKAISIAIMWKEQ
ncbi:MAG: hypothetical protein EHM45_12475 [Desulfobacteraceae bacterium]|nr:MAG: hypothetical protein EHM45_12475 [Desulfobacteraceae bacterium]